MLRGLQPAAVSVRSWSWPAQLEASCLRNMHLRLFLGNDVGTNNSPSLSDVATTSSLCTGLAAFRRGIAWNCEQWVSRHLEVL